MVSTLSHISRGDLVNELQRANKPILVDALSPDHFAKAHLPGAVNLPVGAENRANKVLSDKFAPIVVYCKSSS